MEQFPEFCGGADDVIDIFTYTTVVALQKHRNNSMCPLFEHTNAVLMIDFRSTSVMCSCPDFSGIQNALEW